MEEKKFNRFAQIGLSFLVAALSIITVVPLSYADSTPPTISWVSPTPADNDYLNTSSLTLNTTITDANQTSAFFDWNNSLVGYWNFEYNQSDGTVYDNSTYENNGIMYNFTTNTTVVGQFGNATKFDGSNDYVDVGVDDSLDFSGTPNLTIEAWVNPIGLSGFSTIFNKGETGGTPPRNGYKFGFLGNFIIFSKNGVADITTSATVSTNTWSHVAVVVNGSSHKFYINGVEKADVFNNQNILNASGKGAEIGLIKRESGSILDPFNGTIDELKVYSRALSPDEINASFNNSQTRLSRTFTNLNTGLYIYTAYAIDSAGNLKISSVRNVSVTDLYDSRDTSPPSLEGTWSIGETVLVNGSGWGNGKIIRINVTYPNGSSTDVERTADVNGHFNDVVAMTLISGDDIDSTYKIFASTDGGSTWKQYDTFYVVAVPEFPLGSSIALMATALLYGFIRKKSI